mgnify:CR=1 FL=1
MSDVKVDPATHYDSDCVPDDTTNECSSSKRPSLLEVAIVIKVSG